MGFKIVPSDVLLYIATTFLSDFDVQAWASIEHAVLLALARYPVKTSIPLWCCAMWRYDELHALESGDEEDEINAKPEDCPNGSSQIGRFGVIRRVRLCCEDDAEWLPWLSSVVPSAHEIYLEEGFIGAMDRILLPSTVKCLRWASATPTGSGLLYPPSTLPANVHFPLQHLSILDLQHFVPKEEFNVCCLRLPVGLQDLRLPDANIGLPTYGFSRHDSDSHHFEWPQSLTRLHLGGVAHPILGSFMVPFPTQLMVLHLGSSFDFSLRGTHLPPTLRDLHFGDAFNQRSEDFPSLNEGLERAVFGHAFNQPVDEVPWPQSLQEVCVGRAFDQKSWTVSPPSLNRLSFDGDFCGQIQSEITTDLNSDLLLLIGVPRNYPHSWYIGEHRRVQPLHTPSWLSCETMIKRWPFFPLVSIDDKLNDLRYISLPENMEDLELFYASSSVRSLVDIRLPAQLTRLTLSNQYSPHRMPVSTLQLPPTLRVLRVVHPVQLPRVPEWQLPPNLVELHLLSTWDVIGSLEMILPHTLTFLHLTLSLGRSLRAVRWPMSLHTLLLNKATRVPPDTPLLDWNSPPSSLTHLALAHSLWRYPLDGLPSSLKVLSLPQGFNDPPTDWNLPKLERLWFSGDYNKPLGTLTLPELQQISFGPWISVTNILTFQVPPKLRELRIRGRWPPDEDGSPANAASSIRLLQDNLPATCSCVHDSAASPE